MAESDRTLALECTRDRTHPHRQRGHTDTERRGHKKPPRREGRYRSCGEAQAQDAETEYAGAAFR